MHFEIVTLWSRAKDLKLPTLLSAISNLKFADTFVGNSDRPKFADTFVGNSDLPKIADTFVGKSESPKSGDLSDQISEGRLRKTPTTLIALLSV